MKKFIAYCVLVTAVIGSAALVLPAINDRTDDPNLLAYFSHDEGYLMDLIWYYYSGEKRASFQYDGDYGLEFSYLVDILRPLSRFIAFTPGTFVLILRWFHLLLWLALIVVLWRFVNCHFGKMWQASATVLLFSTNPAFSYIFSCSLKPDPLLLLFMVAGLDNTLRIFDGSPRRRLILAIAFAAAAALTKFFIGTFLLFPIVIAIYLANRYYKGKGLFDIPRLRYSWAFPGIVGAVTILMAFVTILAYKRRISGLTWFQQFGLWGSLSHNRHVLYIAILGISLVAVSFLFLVMRKAHARALKRITAFIDEINSYCLITLGAFTGFAFLFGFKWVLHPGKFIDLYSQMGREAFGYSDAAGQGGVSAAPLMASLTWKLKEFGPVILALFVLYIIVEFLRVREAFSREPVLLLKRTVLTGFVLSFAPYMFSGGRASQHVMLPFFTAAAILGMQGITALSALISRKARVFLFSAAAFALAATVCVNLTATIRSFAYWHHWREEVVFDIVKWWRETYPPETSIVADHPTVAYLPPEYKNVKFLKYQYDRVEQLRELTKSFKPKLIYMDMGSKDYLRGMSIEEILPGVKLAEAASFTSSGRYFKKRPNSRYVVYEVSYQ